MRLRLFNIHVAKRHFDVVLHDALRRALLWNERNDVENILNVHCVLLRTLLRDTVLSTFCSPVRRCTRVWESNHLPPSLWTNAALWAKLRRLSGTHVRDVKRTQFAYSLQDALRHCACSCGSSRTTSSTSFNTATAPRQAQACNPRGSRNK